MATTKTYLDYVKDDAHMQDYRRHQSRYAVKMRESDRVLIGHIEHSLGAAGAAGKTLVDVGCSQGNLLLHLKNLVPGLALQGIDLAAEILDQNRSNPDLAGIEFTVQDMLAMPTGRQYDVVVANAALMFFDAPQFDLAVKNLGALVKPGGSFIAFDYFSPFQQEVTITETSVLHPKGLTFSFRSYQVARAAVAAAGLNPPEFHPFHMPFDLPRSDDPTNVNSYTVRDDQGQRSSFRGAVYQPWCHLVATRG
jgi:SAM-dependent methyltransferase